MPSRHEGTVACRPCACSSPAAPGSSARSSCAASPTPGDQVAVLDKLTYAGQPREPRGRRRTTFHQGDIADPDAVARARPRAATAIVNFAAETHVDRSILGPAEFILTDVLGTQVLLDHARAPRHPPPAGLDRRGLRRHPARRATPCTEDAPIRASSPYSASKAGGDLQVLAYVRTYGVDALITRGANTYGPRQYPEKFLPLFITNAFDGRAPAGLRRRQAAPRVAARRRPLRGDRARAAQGRARRRSTTSAARSARTWRSCAASST